MKAQLDEDVALGVLSKVPPGVPTTWCHRMHVVPKPDGSPRRTIDLRLLNKHCIRESYHLVPPFKQARQVPPHTYRTVTDAWNGYHTVPLREEDRHLTTFIMEYGRYTYNVAGRRGPSGLPLSRRRLQHEVRRPHCKRGEEDEMR